MGAVTPSANLRKVQGVMDRTSFGTLVFYTCGAFLIVFGVFAAQDNPHAGGSFDCVVRVQPWPPSLLLSRAFAASVEHQKRSRAKEIKIHANLPCVYTGSNAMEAVVVVLGSIIVSMFCVATCLKVLCVQAVCPLQHSTTDASFHVVTLHALGSGLSVPVIVETRDTHVCTHTRAHRGGRVDTPTLILTSTHKQGILTVQDEGVKGLFFGTDGRDSFA